VTWPNPPTIAAVVLRDNHVPHVRNLVGGELRWRCVGAT
jgi:hypothetical protein